MTIKRINYFGSDGWDYFTEYNHTPSSELHIPRIGDTIRNSIGKTYRVIDVIWRLDTHSVLIECDLV